MKLAAGILSGGCRPTTLLLTFGVFPDSRWGVSELEWIVGQPVGDRELGSEQWHHSGLNVFVCYFLKGERKHGKFLFLKHVSLHWLDFPAVPLPEDPEIRLTFLLTPTPLTGPLGNFNAHVDDTFNNLTCHLTSPSSQFPTCYKLLLTTLKSGASN